ncbi:MAG: lipid A biosynthesis acyltransferase [Epsilonproteobacteria bacterium]|nr:MAG: lipid A biosynthesis acyltransferase [Campylobacterota bacterium]
MIGFYIFLIFEKFLMLLPRKLRRNIFIGIGTLAFKFSKRYKKVVMQNLKFIYGEEVNGKFVEETTKYSFKLLLLNFLHTMEARHYSIEKLKENISFENLEVVTKAQEAKKPIIFVTSHYGAWELGGSMVSTLVEPLMIVYKKMNNQYFQDYLLSTRAQSRIKYVEKHGATKGILKQLRSGGAIAILIDTNIQAKDGEKVDFLGKETYQLKSTAYFARKFDAALIPVLIHTEDDENYVIKFYDEIVPPKTDNVAADIYESTRMQSEWLSKEILKAPKPWFWLHRRWKNDYPEVYKK